MSWVELIDIAREYAEFRRDAEKLPVACPRDGQLLDTGPQGQLHCPFCGLVLN